MNTSATLKPQHSILLNREDIVAAINELRPNVLQTIADIVAYNQLHPENPITIDPGCIEFIHNCGLFLNNLEKREPERAQLLVVGFQACLGSTSLVTFSVWCDVEGFIHPN